MNSHFGEFVRQLETTGSDAGEGPLPESLRMATDGRYSVFYAPFDHVNPDARVVLVGLTPGAHQAKAAIAAASSALRAGHAHDVAARLAKDTASFSGPMRKSLVAMLDSIGLHRHLGIAGCAALFGERTDLVHFTSMLRYPVFVGTKNFSGSPDPLRIEMLRDQFERYFVPEARRLRDAWFIPMGATVTRAMRFLADRGDLPASRVLAGLPHPSGANAERIAVFLGRKAPELASTRTRAAAILQARDGLIRQLGR